MATHLYWWYLTQKLFLCFLQLENKIFPTDKKSLHGEATLLQQNLTVTRKNEAYVVCIVLLSQTSQCMSPVCFPSLSGQGSCHWYLPLSLEVTDQFTFLFLSLRVCCWLSTAFNLSLTDVLRRSMQDETSPYHEVQMRSQTCVGHHLKWEHCLRFRSLVISNVYSWVFHTHI